MATIKTRIDQAERAAVKAAIDALDLVEAIETRAERLALWAFVLAELGQGPALAAETEGLAQQAARAMWAAASPAERRLLWGLLPLPRLEVEEP
jgi:hypothetical protein